MASLKTTRNNWYTSKEIYSGVLKSMEIMCKKINKYYYCPIIIATSNTGHLYANVITLIGQK